MTEYYLEKKGETIGPFALDQLIENGLKANSKVWSSDTEDWKTAICYPEVAEMLDRHATPAQRRSNEYLKTYGHRPVLNPFQAIIACFKNYLNFSGRARRSEFWWMFLFFVLMAISIIPLAHVSLSFAGVAGIITFVCLPPTVSALFRRLNDANRSYKMIYVFLGACGVLAFLSRVISNSSSDSPDNNKMVDIFALFVLSIIMFVILYLCSEDSYKGENEYGPSPKYQ